MEVSVEPKVAVLIPIFNGEKFLESTLRSVLEQDYRSMIVLICNDGSSDSSQEIIESVVKESGVEVKILRHTLNLGLSKSLVELCSSAKLVADVAVVLGQDDLIPPDYVRKICRLFTRNKELIVSSRAICIDEKGERITKSHAPPFINFLGDYKTAFLLAANQITAPGVAFSLASFTPDFVGKENPLTQDWHQWIFTSTKATIKVCCSTNVFYRKHSESLTSQGSDLSAHLEISRARLEFISSRRFAEFTERWSKYKRNSFFALTNLLFQEFDSCSHNSEFLEKLSLAMLGKSSNDRRSKQVQNCERKKKLSKGDFQRNNEVWEKSNKSLVSDWTVANFAYVALSTFRLLTGRLARVLTKRFTHFWRELRQITIYSTGGLGAQLSGLSYALWLKNRFNRPVKILFHEKGMTFYPIVVEELLEDIPYEIVRWQDSEIQQSTTATNNFRGWRALMANPVFTFMKFSIKKVLHMFRVVVSDEHLSVSVLKRISKLTKYVKGYHTDWSVINESWDSLSKVISEFKEHNFMSEGGSEPTISIHWRLGDFLNNPSANYTHGTVSPDALISCLRLVQMNSEILEVRIFTDSPDIAKSILLGFESEFNFTFISGDIWEDLYEMSRSEIFIGSHSSISTWAAFSVARGNPQSIVYLPNQWFKNEPIGFDKKANTFRNPQEIIPSIRDYDAKIR